MRAADGRAVREVGDGARHFEDALVAAHGEVHPFGGAVEQRQDVRLGVQVLVQRRAIQVGIGAALATLLDGTRRFALCAQMGAGFAG